MCFARRLSALGVSVDAEAGSRGQASHVRDSRIQIGRPHGETFQRFRLPSSVKTTAENNKGRLKAAAFSISADFQDVARAVLRALQMVERRSYSDATRAASELSVRFRPSAGSRVKPRRR